MTHPKRPDKLDLRLAEIEAKVVTRVRRLVLQECLDECRMTKPWCPCLQSTKICPNILETLEDEVPSLIQEMNKRN